MKRSLFLLSLLSVTTLGALAQNNFSPYSQLGLGDLEDGFYNRTSGLANTGIAYRSNRFLINNNPASFSALTNQYFTMETGLRGSFVSYLGTQVDPSNNQSGDITFRRLVMGMKLSKHWGSSIGLVPFSTQNYEFNVPYFLQGSATQIANNFYQGHGSINKAYWANSYEFFHHLSIGVEAAYLFGELNQKNDLQQPGSNATLVSSTSDIYLNNVLMTYGMQLYGKLGKRWDYSLGATFSNKTNLFASTNLLVLASDSSILQNSQLAQNYLTLPITYGIGAALTFKQKYTFLADYKYQGWTSVSGSNTYPGKDFALVNSNKGSVGFEISKMKTFYNTRIELSYFQSGLYYGTSYLQINGQQIKDYGATVGFGVNSLKSPLAFSIVLQYGNKGTQANNLIEERYTNITFMINYGALWYTKGKKYD
jgi:hypothetical protein